MVLEAGTEVTADVVTVTDLQEVEVTFILPDGTRADRFTFEGEPLDVTVEAEDAAGNEATAERTVTVKKQASSKGSGSKGNGSNASGNSNSNASTGNVTQPSAPAQSDTTVQPSAPAQPDPAEQSSTPAASNPSVPPERIEPGTETPEERRDRLGQVDMTTPREEMDQI
ncbi:MAG: hypothetical protein J1E61_08380 [Lachnospiraceae bacterium]|nr:hypothetical protein [Lachnospiraceae bacterium]